MQKVAKLRPLPTRLESKLQEGPANFPSTFSWLIFSKIILFIKPRKQLVCVPRSLQTFDALCFTPRLCCDMPPSDFLLLKNAG
jgi:hypothetical protein